MADLSHWDFAEHFRGKEAAELIMGIPPEENSGWEELLGGERGYTAKITPLLRRMERALNGGLSTLHAAATWGGSAKDALIAFPHVPCELHSETMVKARESATEFGLSLFKNHDFTGNFGKAYFGRSEIARWLDAIEMKSVYQFDRKHSTKPEAAIEPDIDPSDLPEELSAANIAFRAATDAEAIEKPMNTRERNTLLTIIAALAKEAKINIDSPGKAAGYIEGLTNELGAHVAKRTIEEHLKKIQNALETRMK